MVRDRLFLMLFALAFCRACSPSLSVAALYPDIEIIRQDARGIEFVYRPALSWVSNDQLPQGYSDVRVAHAAFQEVPGEPHLPVRLIYFGLPPGADFEFVTVEETRHSVQDVHLPTYMPPFTRPAHDTTRAPLMAEERRILGPLPTVPLKRLPVGFLRTQQIGGLAIYPVTYFPGERRAETLESIRIRVDFRGGENAMGAVEEGAFDRVLSRILLNDRIAAQLRWKPTAPTPAARIAVDNPFGQAAVWYKLRTSAEGIYRVTYAVAESLGLNPRGIADPRQIRIFYGGGRVLPLPGQDSLPPFREVALLTHGFDDGVWDTQDYFEFYGQDLRRWEVDPSTGGFENAIHPFEASNVYWLTPQANLPAPPLRTAAKDASVSQSSAWQVFDVEDWAVHELNLTLRVRGDGHVGDYYSWYWQSAALIPISLYNAVDAAPGQPATLHVRTSSFNNPVSLLVGGGTLSPVYTSRNNDTNLFRLDAYPPGAELRISFARNVPGATYLDGYDLQYHRQLKLRGGRLKFAAPDTTATTTFTISDLAGADPAVWDVTDPCTPVVLTGVTRDGTTARFQVALAAGSREVFWAADAGVVNRPLSAERRSPQPLRTAEHRADLLAIGPRRFVEVAENYLHTQESISGLVPVLVAIEDVYDNFSYGLVDPLAIRWFLKYAFENWEHPAPQYALLVGDGHYDPADNLKTGAESFVPPYLARDELMPSDENYVYFGPQKLLISSPAGGDPYPDMIIGRWAVKNTEQVRAIAEKILRYQSTATLGPWRNRIALVADDEAAGDCAYDPGNEVHILGAESLSETVIPEGFEQRKIYLTEYPFGSTCRSKPEAHAAILDLLNEGALLTDYIGHGNPDLWAHEHVLERSVDVPKMQNKDRLTVMFTASCSNGFFDDPLGEGLAEEVVRWPNGGAVASISATRLVFADANLSLNSLFFDLLLDGDSLTLGEALYVAKTLRQFAEDRSCPDPPCERPNDRKFILFGDPAMRLGAPLHRVVIDDVEPDTLRALGVVTVTGRVVDHRGTAVTDFSGTGDFLAFDALRERRYQASPNMRIDYTLPGRALFRGTIPVSNGAFSFGFVVPKDVTYGGSTGKINGYAISGTVDAAGGIGGLPIGGTAPGITDTTGPLITLQVGDQQLSDGMVIEPQGEIVAVIEDTSGVNLTGEPGHALTVVFDDDDTDLQDITASFAYDAGNFRRGRAHFALPAARAGGPVTVTVKAWDNANNSARTAVTVTVSAAEDFRIVEFLNYPNPFSTQTTFYFRTNGVPARASVEVFTVAGRLIKTVPRAVDGQCGWDGTDDVGQRVANGVYLTRLKVEGRTVEALGDRADKTAERVQKVVVWR